MRRLVIALLVTSATAFAGEGHCHSDQECAPWQQCTVSYGECGGDDAPLDVCTGTCESGRGWRLVGRASGGAFPGFTPAAAFAVEFEAVPPLLKGVPSVTLTLLPLQRAIRAGVGASTGRGGIRAGLHLCGLATLATNDRVLNGALTRSSVAGLGSVKLELFPWALWDFVTPFHHLGLSLEGGGGLLQTVDVTVAMAYALAGVSWWF